LYEKNKNKIPEKKRLYSYTQNILRDSRTFRDKPCYKPFFQPRDKPFFQPCDNPCYKPRDKPCDNPCYKPRDKPRYKPYNLSDKTRELKI